MKRFICLILIVGILIIYAPTSLSNADSKTRIEVDISGENSSMRFLNTKAESYLKRELRKFSDVEIVDDSPDYVIAGMAAELKTDRYGAVYIVAITILKRQDLRFWNVNLGYDVFTVMGQQIGYDTDLEDICHDYAVIVDSEVLELHRQIRRSAKESAENLMNELGIEKNDK